MHSLWFIPNSIPRAVWITVKATVLCNLVFSEQKLTISLWWLITDPGPQITFLSFSPTSYTASTISVSPFSPWAIIVVVHLLIFSMPSKPKAFPTSPQGALLGRRCRSLFQSSSPQCRALTDPNYLQDSSRASIATALWLNIFTYSQHGGFEPLLPLTCIPGCCCVF